ncbi:uncharacterized protein LOC111634646 [Centruroides sculpturatus]|uniref:uncharacterized protein LOC111634646 n=1 Tax=Centruroides sculpturatus TaxID=218467 RepID=UPI000C6DE83A|nr:uncharacterized protein LOC111634646 [Centruroides sculpturatus]
MEHLESFYSKVKDQISSQEDALVVMLHHYLLSNRMHCVGTGEEWIKPVMNIQKDKMPPNWNSTKESYKLRYVDDNANRFLMEVHPYETKRKKKLFVYLHCLQEKNTCATVINVKDSEDTGKSPEQPYKEEIQIYQNILQHMKDIVSNRNAKETEIEMTSKRKLKEGTSSSSPAPTPETQEISSKTQKKQSSEPSSKKTKEHVTSSSSKASKKGAPKSPSKAKEQEVPKKKGKVSQE